MNNRNRILLGLLIVQLVVIGSIYRPGHKEVAPTPRLLPELASAEVRTFTIADEEGGAITLAKGGGKWQVTAVSGPGLVPEMAPPVPADAAKVEALLEKLAGLVSRRVVARTPASQGRLKVAADRFVRRIEVTTRNGAREVLFLGSAPGFNTIHARTEGASEVHLTEGVAVWEAATDLPSWWRTDYLELDPDKLQGVTLANKAGTLELVRSEEGGWQLADAGQGEVLSQEAVADFLNSVSYLEVSDYVGREGEVREAAHGLSRPAARLVFDTGRETVELRIGPAVRDSDERVVKSSASPYYVKIAALRLEPMLVQTKRALMVREEAGKRAGARLPSEHRTAKVE